MGVRRGSVGFVGARPARHYAAQAVHLPMVAPGAGWGIRLLPCFLIEEGGMTTAQIIYLCGEGIVLLITIVVFIAVLRS